MAFDLSNPIGTGTDQELLDFTRAAIAKITLHGQAYSADGTSLTRANLRDLREQEAYYQAKVDAAAGAARSRENVARIRRPA